MIALTVWGLVHIIGSVKSHRKFIYYFSTWINIIGTLAVLIAVRLQVLHVSQFSKIIALVLTFSFMIIFVTISLDIKNHINSSSKKAYAKNENDQDYKNISKLENENYVLKEQVLDNVKFASVGKVTESLSMKYLILCQ